MENTFVASLTHQIELLNDGDPLGAFDRYFADDGVMYDNDQVFGVGKVECRGKQEPFISAAACINGNITSCSLDADQGVCAFRNQSAFVDGDGKERKIDGLHLQRWEDGRIIEERYYRGDLMTQKISDGLFDLGSEL
jgi:hypothetical protein